MNKTLIRKIITSSLSELTSKYFLVTSRYKIKLYLPTPRCKFTKFSNHHGTILISQKNVSVLFTAKMKTSPCLLWLTGICTQLVLTEPFLTTLNIIISKWIINWPYLEYIPPMQLQSWETSLKSLFASARRLSLIYPETRKQQSNTLCLK